MDERDELDGLLARGRLSGPERERIFEEVAKRVRGDRSRWSKYALVAGPIALATAVALTLRPAAPRNEGFVVKGIRESHAELGCSGGTLAACPRGAKLVFRVDATDRPLVVQAYAQPSDASRERIWYFPTAANPAPQVEPDPSTHTLRTGIVVGPEHSAGRYRVHVVLSVSPLAHDEILRGDGPKVVSAEAFDVEVIEP